MAWIDPILDRLASVPKWSYHAGGSAATEPTALSALALLAHQRLEAARNPLRWLVEVQAKDGSLGITKAQASPGWPTSLALLAWLEAERTAEFHGQFRPPIDASLAWTFKVEGKPLDRTPALAHDSTLIGWPWVETTHSWVEPTALAALALKAAGQAQHPRTREAIRLLTDRLLPDGGCNYGNTFVFGQHLRPHVQPTGVCLLALAGEADASGRIAASVDYLRRTVPDQTATASLCYGAMGLAAHRAAWDGMDARLQSVAEAVLAKDPSRTS